MEHRVREVLEEKLAVIFEEFGIDKTGDVLDSAQAGQIFDGLYVEAILNSEDVGTSVDKVITRLQDQVRNHRLALLQQKERAWSRRLSARFGPIRNRYPY